MKHLAITLEKRSSTTYYLPERPERTLDEDAAALTLVSLTDERLAHLPHHTHPSSIGVLRTQRVPKLPAGARAAGGRARVDATIATERPVLLRFAEHGSELPRVFAERHANAYQNVPTSTLETLRAGPNRYATPLDVNDPYWNAWWLLLALARDEHGRTLAHADNLDLLLIDPQLHPPEEAA